MSAEAERPMSSYRYAYLGVRRIRGKLHILRVDHGLLCRPGATDYWTPRIMAAVDAGPDDGWWHALVADDTLCARCRNVVEKSPGKASSDDRTAVLASDGIRKTE